MTGSSSTSIWTQYKSGVREYCGISMPEGMRQNEAFLLLFLLQPQKKKLMIVPFRQEIIEESG